MLLKALDGSSQTIRGAISREIHLQGMHKGLPTCHVLLWQVQVVWCFLSCLNTSVLVLMSWDWGEGEHVKCFHYPGPKRWVWSLAVFFLSLFFPNDALCTLLWKPPEPPSPAGAVGQ